MGIFGERGKMFIPPRGDIDPKQYKLVKVWLIISMVVSSLSILALVRAVAPIVPLIGLGFGLATFFGVFQPLHRGQFRLAGLIGMPLGAVLLALNIVTVINLFIPGTVLSLAAQAGVLYAGVKSFQWSKL